MQLVMWCGVRDGYPDFGPTTFFRKPILKGEELEESERLRMVVGRACLSKTGR